MKYSYFFCLLLIGFLSCEKPVFLPVQGTITGVVRDNNGFPLEGVPVQATFDPPDNPAGVPLLAIITSLTDRDGVYRLDEVWDRVELTVQQPGFQPAFRRVELLSGSRKAEVTITLTGSPAVQSIQLSKNTLSLNQPDTISFRVEVQDLYNSGFGPYAGKVLLKNDRGQTELILTAVQGDQSNTQFILEAVLLSGLLPTGNYRVIAEVTDPDGNSHLAEAPGELRVE